MVLGVYEPTFPFDSYLQAKTQYSPKYVAGQAMGDLGAMLPQLIQYYQQEKQKKQQQAYIQQLVETLKSQGQPIQGPSGYVPPGSGPSATPAGQIPPQNRANITASAIQADPNSIGQVIGPLLKQPKPGTNMPAMNLAEKIREFQVRQQNFKETMDFRRFVADLANVKNVQELKQKIQAWQGAHPASSFLGFGPTEESVGLQDGWGEPTAQ